MRLTRRAALAGLGALALPSAAQAVEQTRFPIGVSARPITAFEPRRPEQRRFGALQFRSGLVLSSGHPRFGGLSGLARLNGGRDLVAVTDRGYWLTAKVASSNGKLTGLEDVEMAAILGGSGRPLSRSGLYDTESLCIHDGTAYVGIERKHEIARFDWARDGVEARARPVPVPPELKRLPRNRGLEALGVMPAGPFKGALVAIAERSGKEDEPTLGALLGGPQPGLFKLLAKRREHGGQVLHWPGQLRGVQQAAVPHGMHLQPSGTQGSHLRLFFGRGNVFTDKGAGTHGTRQGRQGGGGGLIQNQ